MNGLADLNPKRLEINKDVEEKGRKSTEYKIFFDGPEGEVVAEFLLANELKMGAEQIVRVFRSYVETDLKEYR